MVRDEGVGEALAVLLDDQLEVGRGGERERAVGRVGELLKLVVLKKS